MLACTTCVMASNGEKLQNMPAEGRAGCVAQAARMASARMRSSSTAVSTLSASVPRGMRSAGHGRSALRCRYLPFEQCLADLHLT